MMTEIITETDKYASIKKAIWVYFLLWVFEGALRKWVLPGLATPLLVVRDPIAVFIILRALYLELKFVNTYLILGLICTLLSLIVTLTFGHGNLFVAIYGARIMVLHFPLIFIMGAVLTKADVLKMGQYMLGISILMTVLIYFQFNSPQTAYVNVGVGGEGSSGFNGGALGYFRPSGTFSFIIGLAFFYIMTSVFVFYFWLSKESCNKVLLYGSTIALLIGLPLTISRTAVGGVVLVAVFAFLGSATSVKTLFKVLMTVVVVFILFTVLQSTTTIFSVGTEVFMARVDNANQGGTIEDSFFMRIFNDFSEPIIELLNQPMFIGKLGMGTNAGAQILTGSSNFIISEGELGRLGGEQGLLLGGGTIALRLMFAIGLFYKSIKLSNTYKLLPVTICGSALFLIMQGQWAQPSVLGAAIIITGLLVASINIEKETVE